MEACFPSAAGWPGIALPPGSAFIISVDYTHVPMDIAAMKESLLFLRVEVYLCGDWALCALRRTAEENQ